METIAGSLSMLGESPVWDEQSQNLYWVDILKGVIHRYNVETTIIHSLCIHQPVGCVCLTRSGRLIGAMQNGFHFINQDGTLEFISDPESDLPNNRFNDGKCDAKGRFWAGSMSMIGQPAAGSLYCLDADKNITSKLSGISVSNGLGWSPDNTFYHIDTPMQAVMAFDFDIVSGDIGNQRVVLPIPREMGRPDGMTVDEDGMLWIAMWGGGKIWRCNPYTGQWLQQFDLPVSKVSSCTFGGPNLCDLYVTTAYLGMTESSRAQEPLAGAVFVIKNCGKGLPAARFHEKNL